MTEFQSEIVKMVIDNALLGAVALLFGYYLSRRLELLRTKKAYELYVWEQRTEAAKKVSELVTAHNKFFEDFVKFVPEHASGKNEETETERLEMLKQYEDVYPRFILGMRSQIPFLPQPVVDAIGEYLDLWVRTEKILATGQIDMNDWPTKNDVTRAASVFMAELGNVFNAGPDYVPQKTKKR